LQGNESRTRRKEIDDEEKPIDRYDIHAVQTISRDPPVSNAYHSVFRSL